MADFLASFNFNGPGAEPQEEPKCISIDDVKARLRGLFEGKVSPTRAEHIDATIEIAQAAQFTVPKDQRDATDPTTLTTEAVLGSQLLANQPQYDPAVQTAVTKLLVAAIGEIDSSSWTVKDITRQTQGWVFAYECRDSWQHWSRRGKPIKSLPIAECSQKGPDNITGARPAFDCRGYLTISFLRNEKAISISYVHTPIHRTVSQAYEYFKPAPPPPPPVPENAESTTAKKPRKSDGSKRKRPTANGVNEDGTLKEKTKRKSVKTGTVSNAELVLVGASQDTQNLESVAQTAHAMANGTAAGDTATNSVPALRTTFNVSPEEAARRQAAASAKLHEAGVDPNSLSADQFNIFSNQSPEVQKESLNMLVKYGAERLRIVQPANRDSPATSSAATPAGTAPGRGKGAAAQRTNGHNGHGNVTTSDKSISETPQKKARKPEKSRLVCFSCKGSRTKKCSKDRPTCVECAAAGIDCEYPRQKPRSRKSAATVVVDEEGEREEDEAEDAEGEPSTVEDNNYNEADELSDYPTAPIANMLTTNAEDANTHDPPTYGNHPLQPQAMSLPHADPPQPFQLHPSVTTSSGLALPQERTYYQPYVSPDAVSASPYAAPSQMASAADSVHTTESSISPHLTMQNNTPDPLSGKKQSHPHNVHRNRSGGHNNRPNDGGLHLPLAPQTTRSPNIGHNEAASAQAGNSGTYHDYPELGGQSGAYYTAQRSSPRIAYQPCSYKETNDNNLARHSLADQQRRSMASPHGQVSVRPPPSDGSTQNYAGNNRQSVTAKQNSSHMRQNSHQGTQSPLAPPSLSQRKQGTQSPAAVGQQQASYGSYPYTQPNQQSQQGGSGWYGTSTQGGTNQSPRYSWGMSKEGWPRMQ